MHVSPKTAKENSENGVLALMETNRHFEQTGWHFFEKTQIVLTTKNFKFASEKYRSSFPTNINKDYLSLNQFVA
jgi:hypothetical protein